jgi:NitT/TauT family transport system ATP-binding protein
MAQFLLRYAHAPNLQPKLMFPVVKLSNIWMSFSSERGERTPVLQDVSMELSSGELVAILGPSGCGKSTLLSLIPGLVKPEKGAVAWTNAALDADQKVPHIGMMFQDPLLFPWRTAYENVMLPLEIERQRLNVPKRESQDHDRVVTALAKVGLLGFEGALPNKLSGGMRARVAIARTLVTDPNVIIMDEPFASLDDISRAELNIRLLEIKKESQAAMAFVTHSISEAVLLADRVIMLSKRPARVVSEVKISFTHEQRTESLPETPEFAAYVRELRLALKAATE